MLPDLSDFVGIIKKFEILKHETKRNLTKTKLRIELIDDTILCVSEVRIWANNWFEYAYQWQKSDNSLIIRWDNAPYQAKIETFPYHQHVESETNILPSPPMTLIEVLTIIAKKIKHG